MAGLLRTFFKSKKPRIDGENCDDFEFQSCSRSSSFKTDRKPTARFADESMLPATAAYHTASAPRLRRGPQSCPGGYHDESIDERARKRSRSRKHDALGHADEFIIDSDKRYHSRPELRSRNSHRNAPSDEENDENYGDEYDRLNMYARKSHFYQQQWENSERQRREERRKQEQMEREKKSIQDAMSNMAICMASVQQLEQVKRERDEYKREMMRYKSKCEKLENKYKQLENATMSPSYGAFQTPHFPAPLSFNYPTHSNLLAPITSTLLPKKSSKQSSSSSQPGSSLLLSHTRTTIGSDGAGESLANPCDVSFMRDFGASNVKDSNTHIPADDDDVDEVRDFRSESPFPTLSTMSGLTHSTATTDDF
ncbi:unnamed protein product [Caenorhabditis sp. 36 PRJEB53466]|nr:unnamed protein product [Caenorhabditis sp. 36 PRJEB53466]